MLDIIFSNFYKIYARRLDIDGIVAYKSTNTNWVQKNYSTGYHSQN